MRIDVEALLAPISDESPAGVDLADDDDRLAVDDLFASVQRDDFDGEEPNWRAATETVIELLRRSKDLWLAVYLCRAGAKLGDLEQVAGGAALLAGFAQDWDGVYPAIEDVGAHGRKSQCGELALRRAFLTPLAAAPLVRDARQGAFSLADIEGFASPEEADIGFTRIMDGDGKAQLAASLGHVARITEAIKALEAAFKANTDSTADWPDFEPLHAVLGRIRRVAAVWLGGDIADAAPAAADESVSSTPASEPSAPAGAPGAIRNRDDVVRAIDAICAYYARHEPASPVPLVLNRAKGWVTLDFLAVLEDIAPGSAHDARRVLSPSKSDDN